MERQDTFQFNPVIQHEFLTSCLGKKLGEGIGRRVFESLLDNGQHSFVVKIEDCSPGRFQNVYEWQTWQHVKGTKWAKWFAPCEWISSCGSVMLQRRTTPASKFPERMPVFLTDFKRANYGMLDGRVVCHDYGTNVLQSFGLTDRVRKVEWWD